MKLVKTKLFLVLFFLTFCISNCVQREVCNDCEISKISDQEFKDIAADGLLIKKGDTSFVSINFRASDFFINNKDTVTQFYIAKEFSQVAEALQNWTNKFNTFYDLDVDIRLTSTYRSRMHNKRLGGAKNSLHLYGKAVDFQFSKANKLLIAMFHLEYLRNGALREKLESLGISSFIFYDKHIHLAIRGIPYFEDKRHRQFKNMYQ